MEVNDTENNLKKVRNHIWYERLLFLPIKLLVAYMAYTHLEHGVFYILAYILFSLSERNTKQFVTTQEIETIVHNTRISLGEHINKQNTDLFKRIEKLEEQELQLVELDVRISDLEGKYEYPC